jgi:hypothetical protein
MTTAEFGPIFAHRETGTLVRVKNVDESYAYYEVIGTGEPGAIVASSYSMPVAKYDAEFAESWRPATEDDLRALPTDDGFRPPANTADW